jgi:hypothetical protein
MRLSKGDIAFTAIALLVVVLLFILLYLDLNRTLDAGDRKPIGKIVFKERIAQRRLDREPVWENLRTESPVYARDTIRTENLSEAEIVLNDGSRIALEENTLIVLNFAGNEALLDFSYGGIRAASASGADLKVRSGNTEINLAGAEARLSSDRPDSIDLEVKKGRAAIQRGGISDEVSENEVASLERNEIKKNQASLTLLEPGDGERRIIESNTDQVVFRWSAEKPSRFELSRTRDFRAIIMSRNAAGSVEIPLSPGIYFWRVVQEGEKPVLPRGLSIIQKHTVTLYSPANGQALAVRGSEAPVQFSWSPIDHASSYQVIVSRDASGNDVVRQESSYTTLITLSLPPGNYFWRIRPVSSVADAVFPSAVSAFTVKQLEKTNPPVPVSPADVTFLKRIAEKGIVFSFKETLYGARYRIQVSKDPRFDRPLVSELTSTGSLLLRRDFPEGKYYWRVLTEDGEPSGVLSFSILNRADITPIFPAAGRFVVVERNEPVNFRWQSSAGSTGAYRLIISKDADLKNPVVDQLASAEASQVRLEQGQYYWKVIQTESTGEVIGESRIERCTVAIRPPAVIPEYPLAGAPVDMTQQDSILFRWKPVDGADSYHFRLYREPGRRPIFDRLTADSQLLLNRLDLLDTGLFSWSVTVRMKGSDVEGEEAVVPFRIKLDDGQRPEFLSPDTIFVK